MKAALGPWSSFMCFISFLHNLFISLWELFLETVLIALYMDLLGYLSDLNTQNIFHFLACGSIVLSVLETLKKEDFVPALVEMRLTTWDVIAIKNNTFECLC